MCPTRDTNGISATLYMGSKIKKAFSLSLIHAVRALFAYCGYVWVINEKH